MPQMGFWELRWIAPTLLIPALVYACWSDCRFRRIPNWLTATVAATGLLAQTLWLGRAGLESAALGMATGFCVLILFWLVHAMGAGDVKLMAAVGAWLGPQLIFYAVVLGALVGGVMALAMIVYQRRWAQTSTNIAVVLTKLSSVRTAFSDYGSAASLNQSSRGLPYAIPMAIGTLIAVFYIGLGGQSPPDSGWWGML